MDKYKLRVYLEDAIKIILDRRQDNPLTILQQYLQATLEGDHILLREYSFLTASPLNRKCFLQQIKKVFHTTTNCFKIITALDYLQLLILVCPEFPKSLMAESIKCLPLADASSSGNIKVSQKVGDDMMFEKYDLNQMQTAVCIFFYYNEFMEQVRKIFLDCQQKETLDIHEECSVYLIFSSISNSIKRLKQPDHPFPTIEEVLETIVYKEPPIEPLKRKLDTEAIVLTSEIESELSGTISYCQFS